MLNLIYERGKTVESFLIECNSHSQISELFKSKRMTGGGRLMYLGVAKFRMFDASGGVWLYLCVLIIYEAIFACNIYFERINTKYGYLFKIFTYL